MSSVRRARFCPASTGAPSICNFLRAAPLIDWDIDRAGIERAFDEATATGGSLIFYSHDVAESPSPCGCSPALLRHALEAASQRKVPIVSIAEALRRAGA